MTESEVAEAVLPDLLAPRDGLVAEVAVGDGRFEAVEGPVSLYRRTVAVRPAGPGRVGVRQDVEFRLALPFFAWLYALPARRELGRVGPERHQGMPWWAPPDRFDRRASTVLGLLAAVSFVAGYLGTLLTQTITFAADDFGEDLAAQGRALAVVRVGVALALAVAAVADRRGRKRALVGSAFAAVVVAVTGSLAPSLAWLAASQTVARAASTATALLVGVVAAEEAPRNSRAYAASVLALAAGVGVGTCVAALVLADLAPWAWRLLYLLPLAAVPVLVVVARQLPESRRFAAPHPTSSAGHGRRFALLAASGFLLSLFAAPAAQFMNEYLREERGFSAARIALFSLGTNTPGGIGVFLGGRLADVRGRRVVGAVALLGGALGTVAVYNVAGWPLWAWSVVGAVVGAGAIPALGVYGPELFPTARRGAANGALALFGVAGSAGGLLAVGWLADQVGRLGPAVALVAAAPAAVAGLVLAAYPETAHQSLEDLNPEDRPPPPVA